MPMTAPGSNTAEKINNSIVLLERRANAPASEVTPGVKSSIKKLSAHWWNYWQHNRGQLPLMEKAKLERYALWYTRAWLLVPPSVRAQAPDPRTIDTSFKAAIDDQIAVTLEAASAITNTTKDAPAFIAKEAKVLGKEIAETASYIVDQTSDAFKWVGGAIVGSLALWAIGQFFASKRRV